VHPILFLFLKKEATLIGPSLLFFEKWEFPKIEAPQRCFSPPNSPFYKVYIYIYKFNFGLCIWDKSVALLGTYWGTH
jgi:hypothetical protein